MSRQKSTKRIRNETKNLGKLKFKMTQLKAEISKLEKEKKKDAKI